MKKYTKILIALAATILVVGLIVGVVLYNKLSPSKEHMSLTKYYGQEKGEVTLILPDELAEHDKYADFTQYKGVYQDNQIYVHLDFIKEYLNKRYYWDANESVLLYATPNAVISAEPDSKDCFINNSKETKEYEVVHVSGDDVYVALDYIKEHTALQYKVYHKPDRVVITNIFDAEKSYVKTVEEAALRYKPDIKGDILVDLKQGARVKVLTKEDKETGYCRVIEDSGVIGYVKAKELGKSYKVTDTSDFRPEKYTHILKDEKIHLVWHQVTNQVANGGLLDLLSNTKGVNVVSPTWFATSDNQGSIDSLASDDYVTKAHRQGVEVWGLCNDFSPNMKIGKVLQYTSRRQKLAKNLIAEAIRYSLDGINIDFENVKQESAEDFIQFIRELGIMCRNNGIVLSIDNYPVMDYNKYYNREEQANVADYIITMAYDEYYSGSEEAGPTSSESYVKNALENVIAENVPENQLIMALPFYCRHWQEKTKNGTVNLTSEACSMRYAQQILQDSGKDAVWDSDTGMNYLQYTKDGVVHKMWIEDINSLKCKLDTMKKHNIGGLAFWKLGMEPSEVWDTIIKYK